EVATTRGTRARHFSLQRWSHQIPLSGDPHQVLAPLHPYTPVFLRSNLDLKEQYNCVVKTTSQT
ncbi:hypothetical protein, partial [Brasilonema octagenarum]|uniref:hypothetical protein n=1 Tax=Brasilonema octagenarum TaxID=417105 RepID=UPI001B7D17B3